MSHTAPLKHLMMPAVGPSHLSSRTSESDPFENDDKSIEDQDPEACGQRSAPPPWRRSSGRGPLRRRGNDVQQNEEFGVVFCLFVYNPVFPQNSQTSAVINVSLFI